MKTYGRPAYAANLFKAPAICVRVKKHRQPARVTKQCTRSCSDDHRHHAYYVRRRTVCDAAKQFTRESESPASPTTWKRIVSKLRFYEIQSISCDGLLSAKASGAAVIDVRPKKEYESGFIEDSINIPLYELIKGWSPRKAVTRLGFLAFGVLNGTELNENFFDEVEQVATPEDDIILVCGQGGTVQQNSANQAVFPSRSLIAAHELICNGYKNVRVLQSGARGWDEEGRDMLMVVDE